MQLELCKKSLNGGLGLAYFKNKCGPCIFLKSRNGENTLPWNSG
jgi:hypothetical protein